MEDWDDGGQAMGHHNPQPDRLPQQIPGMDAQASLDNQFAGIGGAGGAENDEMAIARAIEESLKATQN